jgi:hypothetical protein
MNHSPELPALGEDCQILRLLFGANTKKNAKVTVAQEFGPYPEHKKQPSEDLSHLAEWRDKGHQALIAEWGSLEGTS